MQGRRPRRTLRPGADGLSPPRLRPRPRPGPRSGQDLRRPHLVPTCQGPRRDRLRVFTRLLPRHLRKQRAGTVLQTSGELSPPTLGCNLGSAGRELRAGLMGQTRWEPAGHPTQWAPENLGFWRKASARTHILRGLPSDVAKLDAGPAPLPAPAGGSGPGSPRLD